MQLKSKILCFSTLFILFFNSTLISQIRSDTMNYYPKTIFYSVFVQSFYDSNNNGIGDINGITQKLDYLSNLGIGCIWLLPVHPSPTYHKYDITNYYEINKDYGTLNDFHNLVSEAHKRNIKIIIDLVVNHTSSEHPWFKEAIKSPENPYRDYYVWSSDTAVINKNPWQWHNVSEVSGEFSSEEKYYGFFWKTMPDLNYDNPKVREEIKNIGRFWLQTMNIDGFRLDAIRFIYPEEEKEKNYQWWQEFREAMNLDRPGFFMVSEVWGVDTIVAPFLHKGVHASFNFDLSFGIEKILKEEKDFGLIDTLLKIRSLYKTYSNDFTDAIFLKNHDQDRILSVLNNDKEKAKLAASILFTLPGAPFIYYGEEIGMLGKKPDEYIREPFLWDKPGFDKGQTSWEKPEYSTYENVKPLSVQKSENNSIYTHYKKLINFRNNSKALTLGKLELIGLKNDSLLSFYRIYGREKLLIIHNLTKTPVTLAGDFFQNKKYFLIFPNDYKNSELGNMSKIQPFKTLIFKQK
ncbi:MAG: alpha-amylase [Chlorobi bacterium]|nr:alpha-amylase [Chlorobiota bacterium]